MFPFLMKQYLSVLLVFCIASATISRGSPLPAHVSSDRLDSNVTTIVDDAPSEHPVSPVLAPTLDPRTETKPVKYSLRRTILLGKHMPVGYAYIPMSQAREYDQNEQSIPLSALLIPGIPVMTSSWPSPDYQAGYLLQNFFRDSDLSNKGFCPCIVFAPWSKDLPKSLSKFDLVQGGPSSQNTEPPKYTVQEDIVFDREFVPTTFIHKAQRTVMLLPRTCVQKPEEFELYVNCPLPNKRGVFNVPSSWVSAKWHDWFPLKDRVLLKTGYFNDVASTKWAE
ncbi:hypothetical protein EV361DRAFT_886245 [Lentinula raphanica]|nr:hypothetical protein C8R42DRAFT_650125 [Lentinula raphanica]KAJ3822089.1 hypothetical protein F5880DRAFT_1577467 [Lentinula raphanica]KAJ3975902.1 hypothetical protein EV361DRAFT_886245 [Lentinula raphanica]